MPPVPRRTATPAARPAARPSARPTRAAGSSGTTGDAVLDRINEEQTRAEARREAQQSMSGMPFRFFCPVGEERELIVVDEKPNFVRHEHNLRDGKGKWSIYCSCIAENANCPVCESSPDKPAYFAMYLTVIDLTPYTNKDGIEVPWSKKLLVVKSGQQKKFMRLLERHGSLRGVVLLMFRSGEKDAAIGDPEFVEILDEAALESYYNEYENKDKKLIQVIGGDPFDYEELFPAQTEEMLASIAGVRVNNLDSHNRAIGRSTPSRRGSTGDDWQEPAARPASRTPARPAARPPARAAREEVQEEEGGYEEAQEEVARPLRAAARPAGRPAPRQAAPVRGRAAQEEDVVDDDPPQRPATSMADRRRSLRPNR